MKTKGQYCGSKRSIELLCEDNDDCEAFLNALDHKERRKLDVLFEYMGMQGRITNSEKFKKLEGSDGIFEFKSFQIRLLCFFHGQRVIICRCLKKKRDKHHAADVTYAERCRQQFIGEHK